MVQGGAMGAKQEPADKAARIDATFRNGSLTAIGVVVGFSLGFLSTWAAQPGVWNTIDIAAVGLICVGIALQIRSLAGMLSIRSLELATYERLIRYFLVGIGLTAIGVGIAIFADVLGFTTNALHK
jgi:hypothetical protein